MLHKILIWHSDIEQLYSKGIMNGLVKKHVLVLCIVLQIAQTILSQPATLEVLNPDENLQLTTIFNELVAEQEENLFTEANTLEEETVEPEENLYSLTTVVQPNCQADCLSEENTKRCLCDCETGNLLNECDAQVEESTTISTITTVDDVEPINAVEEVESINKACQVVGETQAKAESCSSYALCLPTERGLEWSEQQCPAGTAFNTLLKRCARDLHTCLQDMPQCTRSGTFPDVSDNNTYIWCVPKRTELGWHKYRVRCATYEVFLPTLGACFIDVQKLNSGIMVMQEARDIDVIKAELADIKVVQKQVLKAEKNKMKLQKKQEKLMIKKAIKEAQERAKLEGADSSELKGFICIQEGAFPSPLGAQFYNNCVLKKDKLKAVTMMCAVGLEFQEESGVCA